jgi:hypothetical protein
MCAGPGACHAFAFLSTHVFTCVCCLALLPARVRIGFTQAETCGLLHDTAQAGGHVVGWGAPCDTRGV